MVEPENGGWTAPRQATGRTYQHLANVAVVFGTVGVGLAVTVCLFVGAYVVWFAATATPDSAFILFATVPCLLLSGALVVVALVLLAVRTRLLYNEEVLAAKERLSDRGRLVGDPDAADRVDIGQPAGTTGEPD
jgi:hypothetical protein